jgi:hypothetical protein
MSEKPPIAPVDPIEHCVDTRGVSYEFARTSIVGGDSFAVRALRRRRTTMHRPRYNGPQRGEEEGTGYVDGIPQYYQRVPDLSEAQQVINQRGIAVVRQTLSALRLAKDN